MGNIDHEHAQTASERHKLTRLDAMAMVETAPPRTLFMLKLRMDVALANSKLGVAGGGEGHIKVNRPDLLRVIGALFDTHHEQDLGYRVPVAVFTSKAPFENRPRITYWIG